MLVLAFAAYFKAADVTTKFHLLLSLFYAALANNALLIAPPHVEAFAPAFITPRSSRSGSTSSFDYARVFEYTSMRGGGRRSLSTKAADASL